jgi:hypothetical protein
MKLNMSNLNNQITKTLHMFMLAWIVLYGKIFSANLIFGGIVKTRRKSYLGVVKNIERMHIHSASIDVHCHKIWDSD